MQKRFMNYQKWATHLVVQIVKAVMDILELNSVIFQKQISNLDNFKIKSKLILF